MGMGLNAFVSIMETPIDYDHFPSITLYKKRGGELRKKNGKRGRKRRRKDLNYKNGTRLRASKANRISLISFFRSFEITVTYISCDSTHTAANTLLMCVLHRRNRDISLYGLHLLL